MKYCPKCNSEYKDDVKFCKHDGTPLETKVEKVAEGKKCPQCGKLYPEDDGFCSVCGVKLIALSTGNNCPKCGAELSEGAKFCSKCGARCNCEETAVNEYAELNIDQLMELDTEKLKESEVKTGNPLIQYCLGVKFLSSDMKSAAYYFGKAVKQDDCPPETFYFLGRINESSLDNLDEEVTEEKKERAFDLYKKGTDKHEPCCTTRLGKCYENGFGCEQNYDKAFKLYKLAAEEYNNEDAYLYLAICYLLGRGTEEDLYEHAHWLKKSASVEEPDSFAITLLGTAYLYGRGVEIDHEKAFELYSRAADMGDIEAKVKLCECYLYGYGCKKRRKDAYNLLKQITDNEEYDKAFYLLGLCYYNGWGHKESLEGAMGCFIKAANNGHLDAMNMAGVCFCNDGNYEKARYYLKKATKEGHGPAMYNYALCLEEGWGGNCKEDKAVDWYFESAKTGYSPALYKVGQMLIDQGENDYGIDMIQRAADQGYEEAIEYLENYR